MHICHPLCALSGGRIAGRSHIRIRRRYPDRPRYGLRRRDPRSVLGQLVQPKPALAPRLPPGLRQIRRQRGRSRRSSRSAYGSHIGRKVPSSSYRPRSPTISHQFKPPLRRVAFAIDGVCGSYSRVTHSHYYFRLCRPPGSYNAVARTERPGTATSRLYSRPIVEALPSAGHRASER